jgi:hypothetical protein
MDVFPFFSAPASPARPVGDVFLEMPYRTPSATATMPLLFIAGIVGSVSILRPGAPTGLSLLRIPLLGAASILGGVMMVGYIAPRYLAEFVPVLTISSVAGMYVILGWLRRSARSAVLAVVTVAVVLAMFGGIANLAIGVATARAGIGGDSLGDYVAAQNWVAERTSGSSAGRVERGNQLSSRSAPDHIRIIGDCDAVYYGTGDLFEPWVPIEFRDVHVHLEFDGGRVNAPGSVPLVRTDGRLDHGSIDIEFDDSGNYRLVLRVAGDEASSSAWRPINGALPVEVWVVANFDIGGYLVASPGHLYTWLPATSTRPDLTNRFEIARTNRFGIAELDRRGITVEFNRERPSGLCRDLEADL